MNGSHQVVGGGACPAQSALRDMDAFLAGPMCGRCFPCALGGYEAQVRLESLVAGEGTVEDVAALERIAALVLDGSMCRKGKDAARRLAEMVAAPGFAEHAAGVCGALECRALSTYSVLPEACSRCGSCKEVCVHGAIEGEVRPAFRGGYPAFEIRERRCQRCGECAAACAHGAIRVSGAEVMIEGGVCDAV